MTPDPKVDEALLSIRRGQAANQELSDNALADLAQAVDDKVFAKLLKGEVLSPEEAHQAWLEKYAYFRLAKKLRTAVRVGQRAAQRTGHEFDLTRTGSV